MVEYMSALVMKRAVSSGQQFTRRERQDIALRAVNSAGHRRYESNR